MNRIATSIAFGFVLAFCVQTAIGQTLEVKRYNYAEWAKGRFSEVITVTGPGKTIYVAGVGAEDESLPFGNVRHTGSFLEQCRYAYDKIKRHLALHGATLGDVVKQVTYVTDIRGLADFGKCRTEAHAGGPIPTNTLLNVVQLAIPGMMIEIDVTAVVPK